MIQVLIVEDSLFMQGLLESILSDDPEIKILGKVGNGQAALDFLTSRKPDVILMDVHMPKMDGLEATRKIMESTPTPIIIVSASYRPEETEKTWKAMEAGAIAVEAKPVGPEHKDYGRMKKGIINAVKTMAEVKVVKKWKKMEKKEKSTIPPVSHSRNHPSSQEIPQVIAIGASTGGPQTIQPILSALQGNFPIPILVVQHIASGFSESFVEWLQASSALRVKMASQGEELLPGHVYVCPDLCNMRVERGKISLEERLDGTHCSVAHLFSSVAETFGPRSVAILLSGMGRDGADELKRLKDKGAATIIQKESTCVVFGMPGEAKKISAHCFEFSPEEITDWLSIYQKEEKEKR